MQLSAALTNPEQPIVGLRGMKRFSFWVRILALVLIAVLVTVATGELHIVGWGYGLPLPWKRDSSMDCGMQVCPLVVSYFIYNWFFFLFDVLFYTAIGHGLFHAFRKLKQSPTIPASKA